MESPPLPLMESSPKPPMRVSAKDVPTMTSPGLGVGLLASEVSLTSTDAALPIGRVRSLSLKSWIVSVSLPSVLRSSARVWEKLNVPSSAMLPEPVRLPAENLAPIPRSCDAPVQGGASRHIAVATDVVKLSPSLMLLADDVICNWVLDHPHQIRAEKLGLKNRRRRSWRWCFGGWRGQWRSLTYPVPSGSKESRVSLPLPRERKPEEKGLEPS